MAEDKKGGGKCLRFLKDNGLTIGTFVGVLLGKFIELILFLIS